MSDENPPSVSFEDRLSKLEETVRVIEKALTTIPETIEYTLGRILVERELSGLSESAQKLIYDDLLIREYFIKDDVYPRPFSSYKTYKKIVDLALYKGFLQIVSKGGPNSKVVYINPSAKKGMNLKLLVDSFNKMFSYKQAKTNKVNPDLKNVAKYLTIVKGVPIKESMRMAKWLRNVFINTGQPNRIDHRLDKQY